MQSHPLHLLFGLAKCWRGLGWYVSWSQITMYFFDYSVHAIGFPKLLWELRPGGSKTSCFILFHIVSCCFMVWKWWLDLSARKWLCGVPWEITPPSSDLGRPSWAIQGDQRWEVCPKVLRGCRLYLLINHSEVEQLWIVGCPHREWRSSTGGDPQEMHVLSYYLAVQWSVKDFIWFHWFGSGVTLRMIIASLCDQRILDAK